MKCPYCQSDLDEDALTCKFCTKDLYLIKPLLDKVARLESESGSFENIATLQSRITELELQISNQDSHSNPKSTILTNFKNIGLYLGAPLLLLLAAHEIIVIMYDANMIYLRLISIALPLPFGYLLFTKGSHKVFLWFIGALMLSIASVLGMSWLTSLVDHSPVLPQSIFEWREIFEYATSIALSFLTGMLLGKKVYIRKSKSNKSSISSKKSPANFHDYLKQAQDYGTTIAAIITTVLSIYTGLKHIVGN